MSVGVIGAAAALPPIDPAQEPADIRHGNAQAKQAYQEALGFEDILVQQLAQELASTVSSPSDSSRDDGSGEDPSDSSAASSDGSGGILGSDSSTSAMASMIPTALTQSIMSSGGLGIAAQLAQAIDPSIGIPQGSDKSGARSPAGSQQAATP